MRFATIALFFLLAMVAASAGWAASNRYQEDVAQWTVVEQPPRTSRGDYQVWSHAASSSRLEWKVRSDRGRVLAAETSEAARREQAASRLSFVPKSGTFLGAYASHRVNDGFLVSFNQGEFGSELHWFDERGKRSYRISGHQVVDFFVVDGRLFAIEGLSHMGLSRGSVISLDHVGGRWQATESVELPSAPDAVAVGKDGTVFIVLSEGLSVLRSGKVELLIEDAPWWSFYANSAVVGNDGALYIGLRQYVARVDLADNSVRYLIPDKRALHVLSAEEEAGIRKMAERRSEP